MQVQQCLLDRGSGDTAVELCWPLLHVTVVALELSAGCPKAFLPTLPLPSPHRVLLAACLLLQEMLSPACSLGAAPGVALL